MPPVIAVSRLPIGQPRPDHRPGDSAGKLLFARKHTRRVNHLRRCLNNARMRIFFHQTHHFRNCFRRHQAVRVQHNHKIVFRAPTVAKILNIAGFPRRILRPPPVIEPDAAVRQPLQPFLGLIPHRLFFNPYFRIGRIAQNKHIKLAAATKPAQIFADSQKPRHRLRRLLVIYRHQHRRPAVNIRHCPAHRFRHPAIAAIRRDKRRIKRRFNIAGILKPRHFRPFEQL